MTDQFKRYTPESGYGKVLECVFLVPGLFFYRNRFYDDYSVSQEKDLKG